MINENENICLACENDTHDLCTGKFIDENDAGFVCGCGCQNK